MKPGDKIRITFPGHPEEMHTVGTVTYVRPDGVIDAVIDDLEHPLATVDGVHPLDGSPITKKRVLTIAPGNYETV